MDEQVLEGTWEEIVAHADEFVGKHLQVRVTEEAPPARPNEAVLAVMRCIAERNKDRRLTSGEDTQRLLREARDGKMWGYGVSN